MKVLIWKVFTGVLTHWQTIPKTNQFDLLLSTCPNLFLCDRIKSQSSSKISHRQKGDKAVKFHNPRFHNSRDIKIFKEWIKRDMNAKSREKIAFYNKRLGKNSKLGKYRNLEWEKPSPTILSHLQKDGLLFIHPVISNRHAHYC